MQLLPWRRNCSGRRMRVGGVSQRLAVLPQCAGIHSWNAGCVIPCCHLLVRSVILLARTEVRKKCVRQRAEVRECHFVPYRMRRGNGLVTRGAQICDVSGRRNDVLAVRLRGRLIEFLWLPKAHFTGHNTLSFPLNQSHSNSFYLRYILISYSHLRLGHPSCQFPLGPPPPKPCIEYTSVAPPHHVLHSLPISTSRCDRPHSTHDPPPPPPQADPSCLPMLALTALMNLLLTQIPPASHCLPSQHS